MHCVIPSILSLGQNSPAVILKDWIDCKSKFEKSVSKEEPLFCTTAWAANKVGNPLSSYSFRKALGSVFTGNTSTHSLRKGGARFYAGADSPEQATRDQGGWRTTETMKEIYTGLTPSEVKRALHIAANTAGSEFALQESSRELATIKNSNQVAEVGTAKHYIHLVDGMIDKAPWKIMVKNNAGILMRYLVAHHNGEVRLYDTSVLVKLRSSWARYKALNPAASENAYYRLFFLRRGKVVNR